MKKIKILLIITFFGFGSLLCAQSKGALLLKPVSVALINFNNVAIGVDASFNKITYTNVPSTLSIYNPTTTLNDSYMLVGKDYVFNSSSVVLENVTRRNKIDSFNPYGASNVKTAVGLGLVNSFLKKIQR